MAASSSLADRWLQKISPDRFRQYLNATGWKELPSKQASVALFRGSGDKSQIRVPLDRAFVDYFDILANSLRLLAEYEGFPLEKVLEELLLPPADVLSFGQAGPAAEFGNVPLSDGISLVESAQRMLLAAACGVSDPGKRYYPRMSLTEAEQFVSKCRLGQTKIGSFVLTVACPLDAVIEERPILQSEPSFTRTVTSTLLSVLNWLATATPEQVRGDAIDKLPRGVSANLCEAILDAVGDSQEFELQISASFSPEEKGDMPSLSKNSAIFNSSSLSLIEKLAASLKPSDQEMNDVFVGYVETLNGRPNSKGNPEGSVVMRVLLPDRQPARVRADLSETDYAVAIASHARTQPVSFKGTIVQARRSKIVRQLAKFELLGTGTDSVD